MKRLLPLVAFLFISLAGAIAPATTYAHAELVRAEPPVNGLVVVAPDQLVLTFTEEVEADATVRVLDDQGTAQQITVSINGRELIVDVPALPPGVWTVEWSVRSSVDNHQLSGVYAFRIGGGLPAGAATTEGETPAAWAVVLRWLMFLGTAIAAAGFLFFLIDPHARFPASRLATITAGALVAWLATALEPILLSADPPLQVDVSLRQAIESLPTAWWFRLPLLSLVLLLCAIGQYLLRRRLSLWYQLVGGLAALGALLGLSFTSHAAGRDSWREVAVTLDVLHQWSTALWVGGLVHLVVLRSQDNVVPVRRFSRYALVLFAIGAITGVLNAGFIFPALDQLWSSDYGWILIVKIAILLVPLGLAIYHRRILQSLPALPAVFRSTLRIETTMAALVLLAASTMALSAPPVEKESGPDELVLIAFEYAEAGEALGLVHLRISPVSQGENRFELWFTSFTGEPDSVTTSPPVSVQFTSLDHGTIGNPAGLTPPDAPGGVYELEGLDISLDGWWQLEIEIARESGNTSSWFAFLVRDPNIFGSSSAPSPEQDPEALEWLQRAIDAMQSRTALTWTEAINTGNDTLVAIQFSNIANPMSVEQLLTFSGSFVPRFDGSPPATPTLNSYHSVQIGDKAWLIQPNGSWLQQDTRRYGAIAEWGSIYIDAEHVRLGTQTQLNGRTVQVITFHTPGSNSQAEAWFAFWIDVETGIVHKVTMIATSHYMVWDYIAFDDEVTVTQPPA